MIFLKLLTETSGAKEFIRHWVRKTIFLKTGCHPEIDLKDIAIEECENGKIKMHLDASLTMTTKEFWEFLNKLSN